VTHDQEEAMTLGERIVVMKDGIIQQADPPLMTYNSPVNRFVAGFIGMPPMNFFDGAVKRLDGELIFEEGLLQAGELTLPGGGFRLLMPAQCRDRLEGRVGTHVVMGIRPEHFHVGPRDAAATNLAPLQVRLNVIEPLGNDMDVYMSTSLHQNLVGRVEAQGGLEIDAQTTVYVDLRKVHFFEPGATGSNLSPATEPTHALA
jgi:multiple sugar transport system ATP-binding protein